MTDTSKLSADDLRKAAAIERVIEDACAEVLAKSFNAEVSRMSFIAGYRAAQLNAIADRMERDDA